MMPSIIVLSSLLGTSLHYPAPRTSKDHVNITIKADEPIDGKRVVHLTLDIAKGWYMMANPVGNAEMTSEQTSVRFSSRGKPVSAKVDYPAATRVVKNDVVGDFAIYEGTITIKATVTQTEDLEAILWMR